MKQRKYKMSACKLEQTFTPNKLLKKKFLLQCNNILPQEYYLVSSLNKHVEILVCKAYSLAQEKILVTM